MTHAFLCAGLRTPIGRYGGALASVRPDDLAAHVLRAVVDAAGLDPARIDEVVLGATNQAGEDNRNVARMAALLAGFPDTVPGVTVNRLCASGLDAVAIAARQVACGEADLIVAGGTESMSRAPFVMAKAATAWSRGAEVYDTTIGWRFMNPRLAAAHGTDTMPETGENVAEDHAVSREDQDAFALRSQRRAEAARAAGRLAEEITPVDVLGRKGAVTVFAEDEHPRPSTTMEKLAALPTPFREGGTVTAGNASGVNDGAAALIVASAAAVREHGLEPVARVAAAASAGVPPRVMGIGPVPATRKALARTGLTIADLDVIELNEAFASQSLAVLRGLGLPDDTGHVNPNGGAIALGHPLGMSGARLVIAATRELRRRQGRYALATLCAGVGQGFAMIMEAA